MWKAYQPFNTWEVRNDETGGSHGPFATQADAELAAEAANERDFRNERLRVREEVNGWPKDPNAPGGPTRSDYVRSSSLRDAAYARGETYVPDTHKVPESVHSMWDEVIPTPAQPPIETREMERGERIEVRSVQPDIREMRNLSVRTALETGLAELFGGFTVMPVTGGWVEDGALLVEEGLLYSVSFENDRQAQERVDQARRLFAQAGALTGQTWVHVEVHRFYAQHTKVKGNA